MSLKKALRNARRACNYEIGEPPKEAEEQPESPKARPPIPKDGNLCQNIGVKPAEE
jgi:hypothetical protein